MSIEEGPIMSDRRILVVAHCYRASDAEIRLISARRASRSESRRYAARGH